MRLAVDSRVLALLCLQVAGYGALLAVVAHSEHSVVVTFLRDLPTVVLVPIAAFGVPAVGLSIALGAVTSLLGVPPESLPSLAFARGDALVLLAAYALAVTAVWAGERLRRRQTAGPPA